MAAAGVQTHRSTSAQGNYGPSFSSYSSAYYNGLASPIAPVLRRPSSAAGDYQQHHNKIVSSDVARKDGHGAANQFVQGKRLAKLSRPNVTRQSTVTQLMTPQPSSDRNGAPFTMHGSRSLDDLRSTIGSKPLVGSQLTGNDTAGKNGLTMPRNHTSPELHNMAPAIVLNSGNLSTQNSNAVPIKYSPSGSLNERGYAMHAAQMAVSTASRPNGITPVSPHRVTPSSPVGIPADRGPNGNSPKSDSQPPLIDNRPGGSFAAYPPKEAFKEKKTLKSRLRKAFSLGSSMSLTDRPGTPMGIPTVATSASNLPLTVDDGPHDVAHGGQPSYSSTMSAPEPRSRSSTSESPFYNSAPRTGSLNTSNIVTNNSYGHGSKSADNISVTSTASSASLMLRKITNGFSKKSKRSLSGIFSGSMSGRSKDNKQVHDQGARSISVEGVSFVHAAPEPVVSPGRLSTHRRSESIASPKSFIPGGSNADFRAPSLSGSQSIQTTQTPQPSASFLAPIHSEFVSRARSGSTSSSVLDMSAVDRTHYDVTTEPTGQGDGYDRRQSIHLERPLPPDLLIREKAAENNIGPVVSRNGSFQYTSSSQPMSNFADANAVLGERARHVGEFSTPTDDAYQTLATKGILKRTTTYATDIPTKSSSMLDPPDDNTLTLLHHDFDISFSTPPELNLPDFMTSPHSSGAGMIGEISLSSISTSPATPYTPGQSQTARLTFSPRITIHDTWCANEYDRRGDVATCNKLTPLLAQKIKEELNAYKMDEMPIAEESRIYTHFFT